MPEGGARGSWSEVWDAFDKRKGAKAVSETTANEGVDDAQVGLLGVAAK